ncbi:hypothetical protein [Shewanella algae]
MSIYLFRSMPTHIRDNIKCVRDSFDNFWNILTLVEAINFYPEIDVNHDGVFDIALYTRDFSRFLVKKEDGFFSMNNPFQVIYDGGIIRFGCDLIGKPVDALFISLMRNAIGTVQDSEFSIDDILLSFNQNFDLEFSEASLYASAFCQLLSRDSGYFRFDDDPEHANGHIHPRHHVDVFYNQSCTIKIGCETKLGVEQFVSLADKNVPKLYLGQL